MTVGTIMALMLAVVFTAIAATKLIALPAVRREAEHLGFTVGQYRLIGAAELAATIGLAGHLIWMPLGVAASIGIVLLLIGAIVILRRAGDHPARLLPAIALGIAAASTAALLITGR